MLFEINLLAGQLLILQHKVIEIVKVAPRFVSEYLQCQHEHLAREQWTQCIFREVIPTKNFALLPRDMDHDIGETHKNLARIKRRQIEETQAIQREQHLGHAMSATSSDQATALKIEEVGLQE